MRASSDTRFIPFLSDAAQAAIARDLDALDLSADDRERAENSRVCDLIETIDPIALAQAASL